jgi:CheY-like chemotaxis protein
MNTLATDPAMILIVDSDPILLTGAAAVLHTVGYECHCARDSQAALKAARTLPLDLIICDVALGSESGLELCKTIRKLPGCIDVPLMFVSSHQLPDIVRRSHEAGAAYYLRKPFDPEVLIELVSKALWMPHLVSSKIRSQSTTRVDYAAPPPAPVSVGAPTPLPVMVTS